MSAKYRVIERFKEKYPIQKMCELFEVSRSGFYKWRKRVSQPQQRGELDQFIIECQAQVKQSYGYRRVLDTDKGLVIMNCCSHGGAVNIIQEVMATFPDKKVYGLIGGFHLFNKREAEIREVARRIKSTGISYVCTGHCTKERAYNIMKEELTDMLEQLHVGLKMEF